MSGRTREQFLLDAAKRLVRAVAVANDTSIPMKDGRWSYGPTYLARIGAAQEALEEAIATYEPRMAVSEAPPGDG